MTGIHSINDYGSSAFNKYLWPVIDHIFLDVDDRSLKVGANYSNRGFECWCALFCRNSMVLFRSCSQSIELSQTLFTIRLIIEISADFYFMSKFPENLSRFRKIYKKHQKNIISSYKDFVPEIDRYRLCSYSEDGRKKEIGTEDRVRMCFGEEGLKTYKYLCGFTHLNYIGGILDVRFAGAGNLQAFRFVLPLLRVYPECLKIMSKSAYSVSGYTFPKEIDDDIDEKFNKTILQINRSLSKELIFGDNSK